MPLDDIDALFWYDPQPTATPGAPVLDAADMRSAFGVTRADPLGRGGFGETWRLGGGTRTQSGDVAAKVIYREGYPPARLARETDGLLRTASPHVVRLLEAGNVRVGGRDRAALVFEFIAGGDVASALAAGRWPDHDDVHAFAVGALSGLLALHATNTAHRDIKPENIALRDGDWSQPVLLDLGLSKQLDVDTLTNYPQLLGTLPFMAPEQIRGQEARKAADVWALGCVLHLLLRREHPFYSTREQAVHLPQALNLVGSGPHDLPAEVPDPLRTVATRMLHPTEHTRGSVRRALTDLTT